MKIELNKQLIEVGPQTETLGELLAIEKPTGPAVPWPLTVLS